MPGVHLSVSHQVLPRAPEYDRTSTTVVNAYVAPRVTSYLEQLVDRLKRAGYARRLMVMQASGGVMTKEYIDGAPIRVLASGPAGGVIGSAHVGSAKRSEEHTSELQSLMRISYAVFCLKKKRSHAQTQVSNTMNV